MARVARIFHSGRSVDERAVGPGDHLWCLDRDSFLQIQDVAKLAPGELGEDFQTTGIELEALEAGARLAQGGLVLVVKGLADPPLPAGAHPALVDLFKTRGGVYLEAAGTGSLEEGAPVRLM